MDSDNVIEIDGNLDDLEAEMNQWQQLPFNLRKISDSNCINKYGYTNIQLYNSIKSRLLSYDTNSSNDKPTLSPASIRNGIRLENARNIVSEDKSFNIIDLSDYNRFDNLMIESETKKDLVPIVFNANYSGTYDGHSLKTIITGCTFYNISICFDFKYSDDCGIYYFDKEDNRYALVSNNINHISQINDKAKNSIISVIYVNKDTRNQLKKGCSNYLSRQTGDLTSYGFKANKINELKITNRSQSYSKIFGDFFDAICLISELNTDSLKSNVINKDSKSNNASIYVVYNNSTNRLKLDFKSNIEDINKKINHIYHSFTYDDLYFFKNDTNYSKYTMIESNIRYTNGTGNIVSGNNINDAKSSSLINNNNDIADKIEYANNIMSNNSNIIIINNFIDDKVPDYSLSDLEAMYSKYTTGSDSDQKLSDSYSVEIWGNSVISMYQIMKNKLSDNSNLEDNPITIDIDSSSTDQEINSYKAQVNTEIAIDKDPVRILNRKLEMNDINDDNLYESGVLSEFNKSIDYIPHDYREDIPTIVPFLSYDEYVSYTGDNSMTAVEYATRFDENQLGSFDKLRSLYNENKADDLISLGWNPTIKPTAENMAYARNKQIKWFNENKQVNIIDATKINFSVFKESSDNYSKNMKLSPIFIVLSFTGTPMGIAIRIYGAGKYKYSHACLSLNSNLHQMYTFNLLAPDGDSGFVAEDIDRYANRFGISKIKVMCLFVTSRVKAKIYDTINWYIKNKSKAKYSIANIERLILKKSTESKYSLNMFCSQFVDSVLKIANIDISGKSSSLTAPEDLGKYTDTTNIYTVYEGKKQNYNQADVDNIIDNLEKSKSYKELDAYKSKSDRVKEQRSKLSKSSIKKSFIPKINIHDILGKKNVNETVIELEKYINNDNGDIDNESILYAIEDYVNPTPEIAYLDEVKIPFGFNNKGDLYVTKTIDLQQEYNEAHKLLSMYDMTNEEGIKHELARLFYINSIIEKKLKKKKQQDPEYKELTDLRARVINDFTKYFKIIKTNDKEFDFNKYIKNSEYYNKTITVDNSTLKFTGNYIKAILKMLVK